MIPSVFYLHGAIIGDFKFPSLVLWSLEIEVQFYLAAPLLSEVFRIRSAVSRRMFLVAVISLEALLAHAVFPPAVFQGFGLLNGLPYFLAGFLLAELYVLEALHRAHQTLGWDLLFMAIAAGAFFCPLLLMSLFPWILFLLVVAGFKSRIVSRVLRNAWVATIGGMCYTTYMYHMVMISALMPWLKHLRTPYLWLDFLVQIVVQTSIILPACAVIFLFLERPFMQRDWPQRWLEALRSCFRPSTKMRASG
jgi:peptidoglycan/LPS O-acetylase OafA/YrhL